MPYITRRIKQLLCLVLMCVELCVLAFPVFAQEKRSIELTDEEAAYLAQTNPLRVSVLSDWPPFVYYSEKNQKYQGYAVVALQRMAKQTGATLEWVPAQTYAESLEQLKSGAVDVVAMVSLKDTTQADVQITSYLLAPASSIFRKDFNPQATPPSVIARVAGEPPLYPERYRNEYYPGLAECMSAVRAGQADMMVCNLYTSELIANKLYEKDLFSTPTASDLTIGFATSSNGDSRLFTILQKTAALRSKDAISGEMVAYQMQYTKGLRDYFYTYPFEIICITACVLFMILLVLFTYARIHIRHRQNQQGYEESYRMLAASIGAVVMEYDCLADRMSFTAEKQSTLDVEAVEESFRERLIKNTIRVLLSAEQLDEMILHGIEDQAYSAEFQVGVASGGWNWYRLIYTVICTDESHRCPIRLIGCLIDTQAEHAEKEEIRKLGQIDQLTGLFHQTFAKGKISELLSSGQTGSAFILLDVDYFKQFNNSFGHLCGDEVLHFLGNSLRETFGENQILCRWGGDEFVLFLTGFEEVEIHTKFHGLRQWLLGFQFRGISHPITISAGGAWADGCIAFSDLFQSADQALYQVKKNGRNGFLLLPAVSGQPNAKEEEHV